jgi:hypothetical protein
MALDGICKMDLLVSTLRDEKAENALGFAPEQRAGYVKRFIEMELEMSQLLFEDSK